MYLWIKQLICMHADSLMCCVPVLTLLLLVQTASFNSITLKTLNKAVAEGVMEKYGKMNYKLTAATLAAEARKAREAALRAAGNAPLLDDPNEGTDAG